MTDLSPLVEIEKLVQPGAKDESFGEPRRRTVRRVAAALAGLAIAGGVAVVTSGGDGGGPDVRAAIVDDEEQTTTTAPPATTTVASTTPSSTVAPATATTTAAPTTEPAADSGAPLWGHRFDAIAATDDGQPRDPQPGTLVGFWKGDSANVYWSGGCNRIGSTVTVTADRLAVADGGEATSVACDGTREDADRWMTDLMRSDPYWTLNGDRLTIRNDHLTLELVLSHEEAP